MPIDSVTHQLVALSRENENSFLFWKRTDKDFSGLVFELGDDKMISCVPSPDPRLDDSEPFQGNMIPLISNSASLLCPPPPVMILDGGTLDCIVLSKTSLIF